MSQTTAQTLGTYARELDAEGIDAGTRQTLVIEAARMLYRDDSLAVSDEFLRDPNCPCYMHRAPAHRGA